MSPGPAWPDCLSKMLAHLPTATGMALQAAGCSALGLRAPMLLRNEGGVALTPTAPGPRGPSASLPPPSTLPLLTLAQEPQESPGYLLRLVSAGPGFESCCAAANPVASVSLLGNTPQSFGGSSPLGLWAHVISRERPS